MTHLHMCMDGIGAAVSGGTGTFRKCAIAAGVCYKGEHL